MISFYGKLSIVSGSRNTITDTISMASARELGLTVGKRAYAVIKATSVMVAIDC